MKHTIAILLLSSLLLGCGVADEVTSITTGSSDKLIWVWMQFNVPTKSNEFHSYYYYGRVSQPLFYKISNNKINSGFILLKDVRYFGKDDLIHAYKDRENTGDLLFRIEDIRYSELIANAPIIGRGSEQYEDAKPATSSSSSSSAASLKAAK